MKVHNLLVTGSHTSSGEDIRLISSSVATINNAQNGRLNSIESITGSLVSKTGSFATTGSNVFIGTQTISGSIIPAVDNTYDLGSITHQFRDLYLSSASLYIDGTKVLSSTTQELQITTDDGQSFKILEAGSDTITLQSNDGNITLATSGGGDVIMDPTNGIIALKGTTTIYAGNRILSSDGNNIHFGNGVTISGSLLATGTNIISGSGQLSGFGFATTGSNNFVGTQTITGSLYISQNLIVQGSSSLQDVTGSNVYIGTNKINLNTDTPSIRFGGVSVFDSGSNFGESGSLLWDSQENHWVYQHPASSGAPYGSAMLISGPKNSGSLGSEQGLTTGKIQKAVGDDHIGDSIITETGDGIGISGSLSITGSIVASGVSLVSGSSQIDVMSTTNIARLATTGSNVFTSNQIVSGSLVTTSNIGAGTPSPQYKLDVYTAGATSAMRINSDTAQNSQLRLEENSSIKFGITYVPSDSSTRFYFAGHGSDLIVLKNSNLGLGVIPSAWNIGSPVIQMGTGVHFFGAGIQAQMGSNNFYNGTNYIYSSSNFASRYLQNNGNHIWETAPSGTSGNTISFSSAMTLDVSGNLSVARSLNIVSNGGTNPVLAIRQTNAVTQGYDFETEDVSVGRLDLYGVTNTGRVQMMTWLKSNGRVGIGSIAPKTKLQVTPVSNAEVPVLGTATGVAIFTSANTNYGLQFNSTSDGTFHIQSQRFDASATAYSLILNYAGGNVGIGEKTAPGCSLDVSSRTDSIALPRGTTAQRPGSSIAGMGRFNTEISKTEFYNGTVWVAIGGAGDGSTSSSAASSAKAIKAAVGNPTSGVYWLQIPNVNGGNAFQCYCDFTMNGGIGYAIIVNQYFTGAESGPSHVDFASTTIGSAGYDTEYIISPSAMLANYGVTKLAVFARVGGSSSGGIANATYTNWVAFSGPTSTQYNTIFTQGFGSTQFTGSFVSADGNTGTAYFPNSHGNSGGVTQISTNGGTVNDYILYEYKQGTGTDPNHFWMVANGRSGDNYWVANTRYGSSSGNVMYNRWGGVALY